MEMISPLFRLDEAVSWRENLRKAGKTLAITNGCFDLLHRGHVQYLAQARQEADFLLVLLNSDRSVAALKGPTRPVNRQQDRAVVVGALRCVDAVVVFDSSRCDRELAALSPDVYVKGGDYTPESLDASERAALLDCGARIVIKPLLAGFSTTNILSARQKKA